MMKHFLKNGISHEKMFNLIRQIKITIKFHYTPIQTANM